MEGYYTPQELADFGFGSVGHDVFISRKASIYSPEKIFIGHHVRIDDFCVLTGNIELHSHIHIGVYCDLHASRDGKIVLEDFSGLSSRVTVYASSDDFSGNHMMARPGVPDACVGTICSEIRLGRYSQAGTGCTLIPGASLEEGTVVGAMSLVNRPLDAWGVYVGIPCRRIKDRSKKMLALLEAHMDIRP